MCRVKVSDFDITQSLDIIHYENVKQTHCDLKCG